MQDDDYDDGGLGGLSDDDLGESETTEMTDLEAGGVIMADVDQDLGDETDREPRSAGRARRTTGLRSSAGAKRRAVSPKATTTKTAKGRKKPAKRKAAKARAARKSTRKAAKRGGRKGARKAKKRVGGKK